MVAAHARLILLTASIALPSVCHAQDGQQKLPTALDLAIPESPAAAILGAGDGTALKPSTAREFAASLLNIVDRKGKVSPGISFEISPALLINGPLEYKNYKSSPWVRMFASLQMSLATANKNEATGKAQDIGLGVRVSIFDDGDPRLSGFLNNCFSSIGAPDLSNLPAPDDLPESEAMPASVKASLKKCYTYEKARSWNARALTVAYGQAYKDTGSTDSDLRRAGRAMWINYGMPIGGSRVVEAVFSPAVKDASGNVKTPAKTEKIAISSGQLILQGKMGWDAVEAGTTPIVQRQYDSRAIAGKLRWGSDSANVQLGGSSERRKFESGANATARVLSAGFEFRLQKDLWLRFDAGREDKTSSTAKPFGNLVFTWAKASEAAFDPRPSP